MRKLLFPILSCLLCAFLCTVGLAAPKPTPVKKFRVALFTPRNDEFWTLFSNIARAACEDLGMELEWHPAMNKHEKQLADATEVLNRTTHKVDAMVFKNFNGTAGPIMELAEKKQVYTLTIEEGFPPQENEKYGAPRHKFKYWIGEFLPDNPECGFDMANTLIDMANTQNYRDVLGRIQMAVVAGNMPEGSSWERIQGLNIALQNHPEVLMHQIVAGYWKKNIAYRKTQRLLQDYPNVRTFWTGNDTMPEGVYEAVRDFRKQHPDFPSVLIGGAGSTPPGGHAVAANRVQVSVGGQFLLAGFSMVLLHDYLYGFDFAEESATMRMRMFAFTRKNIHQYTDTLGKSEWNKIDFRRFSKRLNPRLTKYNFGFREVLEQFAHPSR